MNFNHYESELIGESCNLIEGSVVSLKTEKQLITLSAADLKNQRITVIVKFSANLKVEVQLNKPSDHASGWLFSTLLQRLRSQANDSLTLAQIRTIVAFKTADQDLMKDVLLTIDDYPLTFLDKENILVPYFGSEPRYCEESLTPLIGLQDFEFVKHLGHGGFSRVLLGNQIRFLHSLDAMVFKGRKKDTGKFYAVKQIKKNESERQSSQVNNEKSMLLVLPEEFFPRLKFSFQTADSYFLVMKYYIGGDLHHYVVKKKPLPEKNAKIILAQLIAGLELLHAINIIFRDLKPENLLIDEKGHINYADLAFCRKRAQNEPLLKGICGTVEFMAPEVLAETGYDHRADYYSLGVVLYEMLTGGPPFSRSKFSRQQIELEIQKTKPKIPDLLSKECRDLLNKLLIKDPACRLGSCQGIEDIKKHSWFKEIDFELVKQRKFPKASKKTPFVNWIGKIKPIEIPLGIGEEPVPNKKLEKFSCYNDGNERDSKNSRQQSLCEKMTRLSLFSKRSLINLRNNSPIVEVSALKLNARMTSKQASPNNRLSNKAHSGEQFNFSSRSEMESSPMMRGFSNRRVKKFNFAKGIDLTVMDSTVDLENELYVSDDDEEATELLSCSKYSYNFNKLVKINSIFLKKP